ncbi:Ig-like domain-containing protein [Nocardioides terrisoli]|uniref:Ig-like domain-containing protein n=1 Tax=Nocardioides terrisoli TaxID=3388267 RepID=UPI00287BB421|nr:Ig-like domain-containing protein [Nocardioides marmorisolisilvae]
MSSRHADRRVRRTLVRVVGPLVAGALALLALNGTGLSGATYTATTTHRVSVGAAPDWEPPVVTVTSPGSTLTGSVQVAAIATDSGSGVNNVVIQYSVTDSGTWTTLCTDATAPYSCAWNTTSVTDGRYDLRAVATDNAGFVTTSDTSSTRVVNNLAVVLGDVPDPVSGTITLTATYLNSALLPMSVYFQYAVAGSNVWTSVPGCGYNATLTSTRTCSWASTLTGEYDVRAVATNLVQTVYDVQSDVTIDNTAPTATLTVPPGTLTGTVRLTATAADADSGVAGVVFQERVGTGSWNTLCTLTTQMTYSCLVDTTKLASGSHDFRLVATDLAGNAFTAATQTRTVDNSAPAVTVTAPSAGAIVRGTTTITADASSPRGVTKVAFEGRLTGSSTWTPLCTVTSAPYSCAWDSSAITTGSYDLHAVLTDGGGVVTTSATVTVTIDNSVLRAQDIQATNVTTLGKPANGDSLIFTYSTLVDTGTVLPGWTGAATPITVVFNDAAVSGGPVSGEDWASFGTTRLGLVSFGQDYVKAKKSASFTATMSAATQTVAGVQVTVVTVTLGTVTGGGTLGTSSAAAAMTWVPSAAVKSPNGFACSISPATEYGASDKDL